MNERQPAPPRPSATIVIVRPRDECPEVLLVRRRAGDAFGDSYAFPGGVVDHDESAAHVVCDGRTADEADRILDVADGLDYYSAAIRELFEETGILLARDNRGNWADSRPEDDQSRKAVDRGELGWAEFLRRESLCMAGDALHYFAYWETPKMLPKRWKTRFFIAELPDGQVATHDGSEITDVRWLCPAEALELNGKGELPMPFPTVRTLVDLADFRTVDEMVDWARRQTENGVPKIRPAAARVAGRDRMLFPGDPGYEEADAKWQKN